MINLDKLTYAGNLRNIKDLRGNKRHRFVKGDVRNRKLADSLVGKVDAVVNFAAESHVDVASRRHRSSLRRTFSERKSFLRHAEGLVFGSSRPVRTRSMVERESSIAL